MTEYLQLRVMFIPDYGIMDAIKTLFPWRQFDRQRKAIRFLIKTQRDILAMQHIILNSISVNPCNCGGFAKQRTSKKYMGFEVDISCTDCCKTRFHQGYNEEECRTKAIYLWNKSNPPIKCECPSFEGVKLHIAQCEISAPNAKDQPAGQEPNP